MRKLLSWGIIIAALVIVILYALPKNKDTASFVAEKHSISAYVDTNEKGKENRSDVAGIKLTRGGKQLVMVSFQGNTFDNGDGFVRVNKKYHFAPEWAKLLGVQYVAILAGKYHVEHPKKFPLGLLCLMWSL